MAGRDRCGLNGGIRRLKARALAVNVTTPSAVLCDGSSCLQHEQRQYQDPRHNGEGRVDTFVP